MQIAKLLSQIENELFVGRTKELNLIAEISLNQPLWKLIHIYGPAGIGKTALLKRFQTLYEQSNLIYLSGLEGYDTRENFLSDLWEEVKRITKITPIDFVLDEESLANTINELASEKEKVILLLDSFELWSPIYKWFREKWIPLLTTEVRIVTSSRFPLPSEWQRMPGWSSLIQTIEIGSLKKQSIQQYLTHRGIQDMYTRYYIEYYSKGVPLALRVICDHVELNNGEFNEKDDSLRYFLYSVSQKLLSVSSEIIDHQEMLTVASFFWWFDYELLYSVMDEPISTSTFHQFCQLPYIELSENGCWRVNDDIRQFLATDLSIRNPEKNKLLLKKATLVLKRKLEILPANQKLPYLLNTLHVSQTGYIKRFGFGASNRKFTPGPINESDIPILQNMFQNFVVSLKPFLPDPWHQEQFFLEVWKKAPDAFIGIRLEDKIVGFLTFVPLNNTTRLVFNKNPVYQEYMKQSKYQEKEYLIWVISADPDYDPDVTSFILRYIFSNLAEDTLINVVSPFPDLTNLFRSLGFKRLEWYRMKYTNGTPMEFLQLDLRNRDLSMAITQSFEQPQQKTNIRIEEIAAHLKKILTFFHKAESESIIQATIDSFNFLSNLKASAFRKQLISIIDEMERGSEKDQLFASIIKLAYIKRSAKHEAIALRHNLSLSTYYRYLKKGIERIAYSLVESEYSDD